RRAERDRRARRSASAPRGTDDARLRPDGRLRPQAFALQGPRDDARIGVTTFETIAATKRVLIGRARPTRAMDETLLPKTLALPIFASDPISSVAYATEAALAVLVAVSLSSRHLVFPLSIGISALLAIVVLSYRQGIKAYASSGGSYVFAKENLGTLPGLVAAAALLTDYILTVAVSVAAGVFAIT